MAIFHHTDSDGDELEVLQQVHGALFFIASAHGTGTSVGVHIPREAVLRLHNVLGEWLYPTGIPVQNPDAAPLTPADVRALVAEQVADIMALHQSPQAKYVDASADTCAHIKACSCHDADGYSILPDPEPHDVGHPDPVKPPLPVRNPLMSFVQLLTGIREAQAEMTRLANEALAPLARDAAREHPEREPDAEDGWEPVQQSWDDKLFSSEPGWTMCPCDRPVARGVECGQCGHIRHQAGGCTARVRRVQS